MTKITNIQLTAEMPAELANGRLDQALARLFPDYSRSQLTEWLRTGHVRVDGVVMTKPRIKTTPGAIILVAAEIEPAGEWQPEAIPLMIVKEDEDLLVLNKPAGLIVHPGAGHSAHTLLNALLHKEPNLQQLPRAGIVHRLDKDTSGLLLVAKNLKSYHLLTQMIQNREIHRHYFALVRGYLVAGGCIDAPIGRDPKHRTKMAVIEKGRAAVTHYRIERRFNGYTLLDVQLETGRTHQIRVHMAHCGHPIVGDPVYGGRLQWPKNSSLELQTFLSHFKRQALHAYRLAFAHPITQELLDLTAPLPADFENLITILAKVQPSP